MATSGSYNYTEAVTAAQVIALALRRLGVLGIAETINSTEEANALIVLNLLIKEWNGQGADVWIRKTGYMFLETPGEVSSYTVGTSGDASFTSAYFMTTLASDASASATTITVTDDTNISNTDVILVEQADGTFAVDVVNGAPSANSVTLTTGIASDTTGAAGAYVYSWPTTNNIANKLVELVYVSRKGQDNTGASTNTDDMPGQEIEVEIVGEEQYQSLTTKLQSGATTQVFHRTGPVLSRLYVWPTGGAGFDKLVVHYKSHIEDLDATTNTFDLPPAGFNALAWGLAFEMASEYGVPEREMKRLFETSEIKKNTFFDYMGEDASVIFAQDSRNDSA